MGLCTPLHEQHLAAGARMVEFGGWDMPIQYASALGEHHAVRRHWGVFDVSHMTLVDVTGPGARDWFRQLLANDVAKLKTPGKGLYSCMLNEAGGVVDDLIVYWRGGDDWRVVVNAATREQDLAWMQRTARHHALTLTHRAGVVMIAVQGPEAAARAQPLLAPEIRARAAALKPFESTGDDELFIARTGYTGEDGYEVILPAPAGVRLWEALLAEGATPCGLGARDTLRLEAALNLYGQDMDLSVSPLASGLAWTVALEPRDREFVGRAALEAELAAGVQQQLTGVLLEDRGIMRHGQRVLTPAGEGVVTSGGFAPTLERSIALARVPAAASGACQVEIRGTCKAARLVKPPFVRNGRVLVPGLAPA